MKALDLGGHSDVKPITIFNPKAINLTVHAIGSSLELYVTIVNRTQLSPHKNGNVRLTVQPTTAVVVKIHGTATNRSCSR